MTDLSHISIGKIGEELAVQYLKKHGYRILERNYRKKWGELDIVAQKGHVLHFVEVKSASCNKFPVPEGRDAYRPEDHMHTRKWERMKRAVETYLLESGYSRQYTADLLVVYVLRTEKRGRVHMLHDIGL